MTTSLISKSVTATVGDDDDMEAYLLEHNNDNAENNMVHDSTDSDLYGGDYYFSTAATTGTGRGGRRGEDGDSGRPSEKVELVLNTAVMHPLFFELGNDFPPVLPPSQQAKHDEDDEKRSWPQTTTGDVGNDEDAVAAALLWAQTNKQAAENDIIIPVVSSTCAMAQQASRGSTALLDLRKTMERERLNRQTMDTSKSDLAKLMRKDASGKETVGTADGAPPDALLAAVGDVGGMTAEEEDEAEAEMIQRKIRMETKRLEQLQQQEQQKSRAKQQQSGQNVKEEDVASKELLAMFPVKKQQKQHEQEQKEEEANTGEDERAAHEKEIKARQIRAQQQSLPIYGCKEELLRLIGENPVLVLVGETGSGKTTQLVQYLYHHGYAGRLQQKEEEAEEKDDDDPSSSAASLSSVKLIGCSQPRRLAAMGVARRVNEEMQLTYQSNSNSAAPPPSARALAELVGYAIYLDDTTTTHTRIKFMTDGVLLREVMKDPLLLKYSVVILDEAHERSIDTDVLMGVLKNTIAQRSDFKLIVTSATMDIKKFSAFYGHCPTYTIPGKTFEVQVQYSPTTVVDYVADAVFRVCQLHVTRPLEGKQDILVFMTGKDDVYGTCELIKRRLAELNPQYLETLIVLPCLSEASSQQHYHHSSTPGGKKAAAVGVLDPTPAGMRKCVVATNVAETSLTIDGVRYVVDCGFMKATVFRPKIGMNTLQRYPVSQAQAGQRKGRAGRTTEGVCYRLYTEDQFDYELIPNSIPEIQRSSVDSVVLLLKSIGVHKLRQFDFMDPPPHATTRNSMWLCWSLGLLDDRGAITEAGRTALEFPMSPVLATLLLESTRQHCSVEVVKLVAMITADPKNLFELPKGKEETARQQHGRFFVNDSDHLTLLNVLSRFLENNKSAQWARDHFLHAPTLLRACEVLERLIERMRRLRLPLVSCGLADLDKVRYCLALCFCLQAAQRSDANWNTYRPLLNMGLHCTLHPSSAICAKAEMPPFVIYNELLFVTKEYMVMVTAVEPQWLAEAGRGMYQLRRAKVVVPVVPKLVREQQEKEKAKADASSTLAVAAVVPKVGARTTSSAATITTAASSSGGTRPLAPHLPKSKFSSLSSGKRRGNV